MVNNTPEDEKHYRSCEAMNRLYQFWQTRKMKVKADVLVKLANLCRTLEKTVRTRLKAKLQILKQQARSPSKV